MELSGVALFRVSAAARRGAAWPRPLGSHGRLSLTTFLLSTDLPAVAGGRVSSERPTLLLSLFSFSTVAEAVSPTTLTLALA